MTPSPSLTAFPSLWLASTRVIRKVLLVATLLLGLALGQMAQAVPWFTDNFDAYSNGNLAGQGDWTGAAGPVKVQTDFVKSGKSIEASYRLWGTGDVNRTVSSGAGYHYIDFDAAMDVTVPAPPAPGSPKGENIAYIKFHNTTGGEITRFYFSKDQFKILLGTTPAQQFVILDNVVNQQWYHFRIGLDLAGKKLDVWVDDVQVVNQQPAYSTATSITSIAHGQWSNQGALLDKSQTYIDNLTCTLWSGQPPGQATKLISPTWPWGSWECYNVCYPFVIPDGGQYKMYHSGSATAEISDAIWDQWQTGLATSTDLTKWERSDKYEPVIYARKFWEGDVVDPDEISTEFDSIYAIGPCVFKDGSTYKMWYTGWCGNTEHVGGGVCNDINFRIGYATSTDGVAWTKQAGTAGAGSIFGLGSAGSQDAKGVGQPHVIKEGSNYRMWYEGFDGTYWRIFYATSNNGINWTRQGVALNRGASGALDELGARNPVVVTRNGQYEMWYQGQSVISPNYHVLRATSADGITWTKVPTEVTLHPDDSLDGSEKIHVDSVLVNPDNSALVFFAKQNTFTETVFYGSTQVKRYYIYSEVVP